MSPRSLLPLLAAVLLLPLAGASATRAPGPELPPGAAGDDWANTGGDKGASRYSTLTQINRESVARLRVAWTYHTGDADPARFTQIECTPIVVEGVLYATTVRTRVVALDAATGRERWRFDPYPAGRRFEARASGGVNRGVAYWSDGRRDGARRILLGTTDGRLISLDAKTGLPDPAFGKDGEVDLRAGMERDLAGLAYGVTSAPMVFEDRVILGFATTEGPPPGAPGDLRAFDVRTGRQVWRFHTIPRPGEFGYGTWPGDAGKERGGVNAWSGLTLDAKRGIVFAGTGSAAFDFYGGDRPGDNLFANCSLALDARTGKRLWHFQTVHHDLWDYDNPYPPVVVTARHDGRLREAVAQVTKTGCVFLLDRLTGKPLFPVEERPVPASDIPGERSSPTQPFPTQPPPLARQAFTLDEVTDLSPAARAHVLERLKTMRFGPIFTPTGFQQTVVFPGFFGGSTWAGAAFDPTTGMLYVNTNNIPREHSIVANPPGSRFPYKNTGYQRFQDAEGYPAVKPPWGLLTAVDLNRGEFAWRATLGEFPELTRRGIPPTGTENLGGCIVTAGGLVFIGATKDEMFRAFDKSTGRVLWQQRLPAAGYATPCTYAVDGRQYVVIAAAGGGKLQTKSDDQYVAFALER